MLHYVDKPIFLTIEELESLPNLRFLQLSGGTLVGDFKDHISKLRWLSWFSPPLDDRLTNFYLKELIHLELLWARAKEHWGGWNLLKV